MENHVIFELFLAGKGSASGNLQQVNACSPGIAHFCDFHLQRFAMDFGGVGIGNKTTCDEWKLLRFAGKHA